MTKRRFAYVYAINFDLGKYVQKLYVRLWSNVTSICSFIFVVQHDSEIYVTTCLITGLYNVIDVDRLLWTLIFVVKFRPQYCWQN